MREAGAIVGVDAAGAGQAAQPGSDHPGARQDRRRRAQQEEGQAGLPRVPRLSGLAVRLDQQGSRPRHPSAKRKLRGRRHRRSRFRPRRRRFLRRRGDDGAAVGKVPAATQKLHAR